MMGHDNTVLKRFEQACQFVKEKYPDAEIVGPCTIHEYTYEGRVSDRNETWAWYIGEDVKLLLTCDTIIMTRGWYNSKGCQLEYAIARNQQIKILHTPDSSQELD